MVNKLISVLSIALMFAFSAIAKAEEVPPELNPYQIVYQYYHPSVTKQSSDQATLESLACQEEIRLSIEDNSPTSTYWTDVESCSNFTFLASQNSFTIHQKRYRRVDGSNVSYVASPSYGQTNTIQQQGYECPATHPIHLDLNSNGQVDAGDMCSDSAVCEYSEGSDFSSIIEGGFHYSLTDGQTFCHDSCTVTLNIPASINQYQTTTGNCYTYPDSEDPDKMYCDYVLTSTGQSCSAPSYSSPSEGTPSPAPTTNNDGQSTQAPDFYNPDISDCTPTGGQFLCQIPFNDACSVTGNCNSSCAGHNGLIALCYVDFTGNPVGIPSIGGTGPSVTSTTGTTTTTTTTNADGSMTTTTTGTETSVTAGAMASAEVDFGSPNCTGEACRQDFYESNDWNDRNFGTVITDFKDRMAQTDIGSGISSFMQIQASASCPVWSADIPMIGVVTFDQLCTSTGSFMLSIIRAVLLFGFTWLAFQWALIRS